MVFNIPDDWASAGPVSCKILQFLSFTIIPNHPLGYCFVFKQGRTQINCKQHAQLKGAWGSWQYLQVFSHATCHAGVLIRWVHPNSSQVIPAYEELLQSLWELNLEKVEQDKPQIGQAIAACVEKINNYVSKAWKNCIYAMGRSSDSSCSDISKIFQMIKFAFCSY